MLRIKLSTGQTATATPIESGPFAGHLSFTYDTDPGFGTMSDLAHPTTVTVMGGTADALRWAAEQYRPTIVPTLAGERYAAEAARLDALAAEAACL